MCATHTPRQHVQPFCCIATSGRVEGTCGYDAFSKGFRGARQTFNTFDLLCLISALQIGHVLQPSPFSGELLTVALWYRHLTIGTGANGVCAHFAAADDEHGFYVISPSGLSLLPVDHFVPCSLLDQKFRTNKVNSDASTKQGNPSRKTCESLLSECDLKAVRCIEQGLGFDKEQASRCWVTGYYASCKPRGGSYSL